MSGMNERQRYALTHPITDPSAIQELAKAQTKLRKVRRHPTRGFLLMSILAVDR